MENLQEEKQVQATENKLGQTLREAREAKGLTINQVADATRISKTFLQAVEDNDYKKIPGEVFVKGVLRGYGNYLGMDGAKLVEQYKIFAQGLPPEEAVSSKIREATHVKITPTFKPNEDAPEGKKNSLLLGILVLVVLLLAVCTYYFTFVAKPATPTPQAPAASSQVQPGTGKAVVPPVSGQNQADMNGAAQAGTTDKKSVPANAVVPVKGEVQVAIESTGQCWLQVFDGKKKLYEGTLSKGQKTAFSSKTNLTIVYGNIKDVVITVNGQVEAPLNTNQVITRTYGDVH